MKKIIVFALIALPFITFGATQLVKEIKSWDYVAIIQTDDGKNVKIYRFDDKETSCYITYSTNWGNNTAISCVK